MQNKKAKSGSAEGLGVPSFWAQLRWCPLCFSAFAGLDTSLGKDTAQGPGV